MPKFQSCNMILWPSSRTIGGGANLLAEHRQSLFVTLPAGVCPTKQSANPYIDVDS